MLAPSFGSASRVLETSRDKAIRQGAIEGIKEEPGHGQIGRGGTEAPMGTNEDTEREAERYRRAAEETLDQLSWCVDYLYRIGKPEIARSIARNRSTIRRQMRGDE